MIAQLIRFFLSNSALTFFIVNSHNFSPGNAGVMFYTDWLIPAAGATLLYLSTKSFFTKPMNS
jgi:hypothetical protein